MKWRKKKRMEEIPVGAFSDVAFLLIIYFILVTTLTKTTGFQTELPSGEPTRTTSPDKNPSVVLTGSEIKLDGNSVTFAQLREKLLLLKFADRKDMSQRMVILDAAGGVSYQDFYEAMATINHATGIVAIVKESLDGK